MFHSFGTEKLSCREAQWWLNITQHFSVGRDNKTEAGELLQSFQLINACQGDVHVGWAQTNPILSWCSDGFGGTQDGSKRDQCLTAPKV